MRTADSYNLFLLLHGSKHMQLNHHTGCKAANSYIKKNIWKRKGRQTVKLQPKLSVINVQHSLEPGFLVFL